MTRFIMIVGVCWSGLYLATHSIDNNVNAYWLGLILGIVLSIIDVGDKDG